MISRFRRPVFCLVLLAIAFTVIPAQEEDWARGLTSIQSRKQALIELLAERERLEEAGDNVALVKVITRIGELHLKLYDLDSALAAANDARQLAGQFRGSQNETLLIDTLTFSAYVHIRRDENRPAFPLLTEALDLSRKLKYRRGEAESLAQTGSAYFGLSKLPEAEQSNDAALAIWRELQDKRGEAKTLVIQGETYMLLEKAEEATQALKRAESIWRELKDPISLSNTLMDLIFLSMRQGQWQSALSGLNEAEKLLTDKEAEPYLAGQIAMSYGLVYETYAQWERALGKYQESLVHYRDGAHNKTGAIDAGNKVGRVQAKLGHVTEAIAQIEQGLTIAKEIDRPSLVGLCHEDLGQVWLAAGLYEQARSEFQLAVFYFAKAGDKRPWARAQSFLGDIEFLLGNQASARRAYQSALDVFQRPPDDAKEQGLPDYTNEAALSFGLGKLALQQGQLDEAEKHLNRSIELTERLRENASSKDLRSSFLASVHDRYEAYVELLMARHYQQPDKQLEIKAFEASESGRARGLIDSLQNYQREFRRPSDPALLIAEEKLQREEQKLVDARAKLISRGGSEKEREKIDKELTEVLSQYETLQARINSSANFASLFRPKPDYESIKRALTGADTSLLEYSLGNSNSFAWLVTQDGLKSYKLADKQTITNAANKLLQLLRAPAITSEEQAQLQTAINEVTRLVVEPLADQLKTSRLIVVPDGILQYVPFQVLKASAHATEPLVAQFDIIDAPSAFALAIVKKERVNRQAASKLLVGFGDAVFSPDYSPNPNKVNRPDATVSRSEQVRQGKTLRRLFNAKRELRVQMCPGRRDQRGVKRV